MVENDNNGTGSDQSQHMDSRDLESITTSHDVSLKRKQPQEKDEDGKESDDAFSDAPEVSASQSSSRDLTRSSHSTIASVPEVTPTMDESTENKSLQAAEASSHENSESTENGSISGVKSPISQRRISTSSLDEVSLIDDLPPVKELQATTSEPIASSIITRFSRSSTASSQAPSTTSTKPTLPKTNTVLSQSASQPVAEKPPVPPPVRRSPFSWLRSSASKEPPPPPKESPSSRRHTNASVKSNSSTVNSSTTSSTTMNSELLLARIEANKENLSKADQHEKDELLRGTDSLKESFKKIRERQAHTDSSGNAGNGVKGHSVLSALVSGTGLGISSGRQSSQGSSTTVRSSGSLDEENLQNISGQSGATDSSLQAQTVNGEDFIDWDLWQAVIEDPFKVASTMPGELNRAIQAGIPHTIRGTVWQCMAQSKSLELERIYREVTSLGPQATAIDARPLFGTYWPSQHSSMPSANSSRTGSPKFGSPKRGGASHSESLINCAGAKRTVAQLEKVIKKDLGERTSFGKYKVDQKALLNLCKAYALFDPDVGYTQGMTFVATPLLLNMSEEEAFCLFVKLMCRYNLRSLFQERMKGLELRLYQYDRLLEDLDPRLSVHLRRQGIESSLYAAQWFLTLFTYKFPLQLVLRVFDLIFCEGLEGAVIKFGVVLVRKNAETLLRMDFEQLGSFLKEKLFDIYLDACPSATSLKEAGFFGNGGEKEIYRANILVQDACTITLTHDMLDKYETEWLDAERIRREREQEIEGLRHFNSSLTARFKRLEEELELLNKEHVDLLNELVVKNMENRHLQDENEQLATLAEELKKTVEKQPLEIETKVEGKYRQEMDRLMERQLEVHEENQALEDQMTGMEKDLVNTKMQLAEVSNQYEILKNRWNELRKALGD